jgi:AcrR family transcriptional regulator
MDAGSASEGFGVPEALPDARARRRAARRDENRTGILDAAERVFGKSGIRDGSLRQIAHLSGFSTAAIYTFFDNKQHLLAETVARRGVELNGKLRTVAESDLPPLEKLHRIVDVTEAFFEAHPDFRLMLRHIAGGAIVGPVLAEHAGDGGRRFVEAMTLLADIVADGQKAAQVRDGDAYAIAHFYAVLVNEHVYLATGGESTIGALTSAQFHELIDGTLRNPTRSP